MLPYGDSRYNFQRHAKYFLSNKDREYISPVLVCLHYNKIERAIDNILSSEAISSIILVIHEAKKQGISQEILSTFVKTLDQRIEGGLLFVFLEDDIILLRIGFRVNIGNEDLKLLISLGADVNILRFDRSLLHCVRNVKRAKILIAAGANINRICRIRSFSSDGVCMDIKDHSPIISAMHHNNLDVMRILLIAGASAKIKENHYILYERCCNGSKWSWNENDDLSTYFPCDHKKLLFAFDVDCNCIKEDQLQYESMITSKQKKEWKQQFQIPDFSSLQQQCLSLMEKNRTKFSSVNLPEALVEQTSFLL